MLIAAGSPVEAKQAYRRVTETAPNLGEGWYNLGICLRGEGDIEAAIASLRTSIAREPGYSRSYEALGMLLYQLGRMPEAVQVYREWVAHDSTNPIALHMLAASSQQVTPSRAPDEYVRKLFDDSAKTFDADLAKLGYRAPQIVAMALAECADGRKFQHALDAGCGTGLCGPLIRNHCERLHGVDISSGMVTRARARGCYDELTVSELCAFMRSHPNRFDAIVSADTFVYFGDLEAPLIAAREALWAGGVLIYTVEALPDDASCDYTLEVHGRFAHRERYIRHLSERCGLSSPTVARHVLRKERDRDVAGMLVVSRRL
jgi:predicted TPR repeat methyltransferase